MATSSLSIDDRALTWNDFQHLMKGKFSREELSAQWKIYKSKQAKGPLRSWMKPQDSLKDVSTDRDNDRPVVAMASPQLPTETNIQHGQKGKHSGPVGRLYKMLKKEAKRIFSLNPNPLKIGSSPQHVDPAYQASLIAAAWAIETERAAKEAQRLHKEEAQSVIGQNQQESQRRVLRSMNREHVPHDHDVYFKHFSQWHCVGPNNLRSVRSLIPFSPGIYEWGCSAPCDDRIVAFYLGKAGTLKQGQGKRKTGTETIRTLFSHYARGGRFIGPESEDAKYRVFVDLQQRGYRIWFRFRPLDSVEPVDLETWILTRISYPINLVNNGPRREIELDRVAIG